MQRSLIVRCPVDAPLGQVRTLNAHEMWTAPAARAISRLPAKRPSKAPKLVWRATAKTSKKITVPRDRQDGQCFVPMLAEVAREKGVSTYVVDGASAHDPVLTGGMDV